MAQTVEQSRDVAIISPETRWDIFKRIKECVKEGAHEIPPRRISLSDFSRPLKEHNRLQLQARVQKHSYTGQAEGTMVVFDEDQLTITAVGGNHRIVSCLNSGDLVSAYIMRLNVHECNLTLPIIASAVEQFFRGTKTEMDMSDNVLHLQSWLEKTEGKSTLVSYMHEKYGVHIEPESAAKGPNQLMTSLVPSDVLNALAPCELMGFALLDPQMTLSNFYTTFRGFRRWAEDHDLYDHLKSNIFVLAPKSFEDEAKIFRRSGDTSAKSFKAYAENLKKQTPGFWDQINIFERSIMKSIGETGSHRKEKRQKTKAAEKGKKKRRTLKDAEEEVSMLRSQVKDLKAKLRENNIEIPDTVIDDED